MAIHMRLQPGAIMLLKEVFPVLIDGGQFLNCLTLSDTVRESAKDVTELGASSVKCELLGQAKKTIDESIGKAIALNDSGSRVVYLLCGRVENDEWFVHKGSYDNGSLATNPFQASQQPASSQTVFVGFCGLR